VGLHDRVVVLLRVDTVTVLGAILGGVFCLAAGLIVGVFRRLTYGRG
jgi:hypothetical protein